MRLKIFFIHVYPRIQNAEIQMHRFQHYKPWTDNHYKQIGRWSLNQIHKKKKKFTYPKEQFQIHMQHTADLAFKLDAVFLRNEM